MNQITDQIWIGSGTDARDAAKLKAAGIRYILNCAEDLPCKLGWLDGLTSYHCGLRDGSNNVHLYNAALSILGSIASDPAAKVLVHCHEGRSRSVFIVAVHMVNFQLQPSIESAIEYIRQCGRDCNVHSGHFQSYAPAYA